MLKAHWFFFQQRVKLVMFSNIQKVFPSSLKVEVFSLLSCHLLRVEVVEIHFVKSFVSSSTEEFFFAERKIVKPLLGH